MISLASNGRLKRGIQSRKSFAQLSQKFIGGSSAEEAVANAATLKQIGFSTSLFFLGEYVEDQELINQTIEQLKHTIENLAKEKMEIHVSIDPTQVGLQIDEELCRMNLTNLSQLITDTCKSGSNGYVNRLVLDMEDSSVTEFTISLYKSLLKAKQLVAITLQAYLYRSVQDLEQVIAAGGMVRLVKGAFAEKSAVAFSKRKDIDNSFLKLSKRMLSSEARENAFYPVFATHDVSLIEKIIAIADKNGWSKNDYEFEMLYGVRRDLQDSLKKQGERVRIYHPFGKDWWPYVSRRIGENPRNLIFLLKALGAFKTL